jgi:hypothetical protein
LGLSTEKNALLGKDGIIPESRLLLSASLMWFSNFSETFCLLSTPKKRLASLHLSNFLPKISESVISRFKGRFTVLLLNIWYFDGVRFILIVMA